MNTEELSNRLTQILTGITSGEPNPLTLFKALSRTLSKTSNQTTITKS